MNSPHSSSLHSRSDTEAVAAVEAVVRDYIEGWYAGDVQRLDRSLHADLAKRTPTNGDSAQEGQLRMVTRTRMLELTSGGGGKGSEGDVEVVINDVCRDIAAARVLSRDYLDYLHLVKTREGWKIANVLFRTF